MNRTLVEKWNSVVTRDDLVYILGDFCFKDAEHRLEHWERTLLGRKVFILGNHDTHNNIPSRLKSGILHFGGHDIGITHDPKDIPQLHGCWAWLCGHVHTEWQTKLYHPSHGNIRGTQIVNVGVDQWNYTPVHLLTLVKFIDKIYKERYGFQISQDGPESIPRWPGKERKQ